MASPWIRRLSRIAIAVVVVAALAAPVAFPETTTTIATVIATKIRSLPTASVTAMVVEIAVGATLVLLAAIWWLWWRLPRRQVARLSLKIRDPKARADVEDNFRKTVGQVLGGAAVLIGAGAAYWQFTQQQQTAYQQILTQQQAAEKTQQASHDLLISNQVSKGFEQLAGDKVAMRLGGIYGLEGVMNSSSEYHQPVLEALCAFVRESTKPRQGTLTTWLNALVLAANEKPAGNDDGSPAIDVQAALTVIGRRVKAGDEDRVDLSATRIAGADLRGAYLSRADLGGAYLSRADLSGANLTGTHLLGADLSGAYLFGAYLWGANLSGANLTGANLSGANLTANLSGANLTGANLSGADLTGAQNLTQGQLDRACGTDANLPEGLTLKPCP